MNGFAMWMERHKLTVAEAARTLQVSPTSIVKWRRCGAPTSIRMACAAYSNNLKPIEE